MGFVKVKTIWFITTIIFCLISIILFVTGCVLLSKLNCFNDKTPILLEQQKWIHGSEDCTVQSDPFIQIVQYDENTWIFRQNKCIHYEAPFIYLLIGTTKALLIDTGATENEITFPLYNVVSNLLQIATKSADPFTLVVTHSHNHDDHYAGDHQFEGKRNVTLVRSNLNDVKMFFNINWPNGTANLDLGERLIHIIPIPGHDEASIAFYDTNSKLLITGDTFYPGRLYVRDWKSFKESIQKLSAFAMQHDVSYIVGTHIEMTKKYGIDYPVESTYQPEEQNLPLTVNDLVSFNDVLQKTSDTAERIVFEKFIVVPV